MLEPVTKVMPELERMKKDLHTFNRSLVLSFLMKRYRDPNPTIFPKGTLFLGFKRHYLYMTDIGSYWQHMEEEDQSMIFDYNDATGSATF